MKKATIALFVILSSISFLQIDCKDDHPIIPPDNKPPDTTSHNFTWTQYTFGGQGGSSYFKDVAIVNDSDFWAVGLIYTDSATYNAAHWDGSKWELRKIPFHDFGTTQTYVGMLNTIFVFSSNDIFISSSANLLHWDGSTWTEKAFFMTEIPFSGQVSKMWGKNNTDIFCVGRTGAIYHYNGSAWTKLESGTTLDIQDIWGAKNETTGEYEIVAVASNRAALPQGKKFLHIQGTSVTSIKDDGLPVDISSVWFIPNWKYFVTGAGVFTNTALGNFWERDTTQPMFYEFAIRGSAQNDIFIAGAYGLVSHWNGISWQHYLDSELQTFYGYYDAVSCRGNTVIAVGIKNQSAVVVRGERK